MSFSLIDFSQAPADSGIIRNWLPQRYSQKRLPLSSIIVLISVQLDTSAIIAGVSPMLMFIVFGAKGVAIATAVVTPTTNLLGDFIQVFKCLYGFCYMLIIV